VVGIPLGIATGRQLWILFAQKIDVVPHPSVPASVALVAVGALVLAVVVSILPGRRAATTPAAVVLRRD
jgi:ABC-type lipoprotein release transport system permease subunit